VDAYNKGHRALTEFVLNRDNSLDITLSFAPGPHGRVSNAELLVQFQDGQIVSIHPESVAGPESEAKYTEDQNNEMSATAGVTGGAALANANVSATVKHSHGIHMDYTRTTRSRIQGLGVKTRKATWTLEEDPGPAGRQGLEPKERLSLSVSVRPTVVRYRLKTTVISGDHNSSKLLVLDSGECLAKLRASGTSTSQPGDLKIGIGAMLKNMICPCL
jgi:hypothetical protein